MLEGILKLEWNKMYKNNWHGLIIAKAALERLNLKEKFIDFNIQQMILPLVKV